RLRSIRRSWASSISMSLSSTSSKVASGEPRLSPSACADDEDGAESTGAIGAAALGTVNLKAAPLPGFDSHQILPPCSSTILLQIASPNPSPDASCRDNRLNGLNSFSASPWLMPGPLSLTQKIQLLAASSAATLMRGALPPC